MKQTIEEAEKEYCDNNYPYSDLNIRLMVENAFEAGAEWQKKHSPWISVKERLPEQNELVLCRMVSNEAIVSGFIIPTYTLQDILDKLPESVQVYDLYIFKKVGLWWLKYVDVTNNGTVRLEKMPRLIDAAYYMLCWCIQKGFVKTNKEVKDERKEN